MHLIASTTSLASFRIEVGEQAIAFYHQRCAISEVNVPRFNRLSDAIPATLTSQKRYKVVIFLPLNVHKSSLHSEGVVDTRLQISLCGQVVDSYKA